VNCTLAAIRGVSKAAWQLGLLSSDAYGHIAAQLGDNHLASPIVSSIQVFFPFPGRTLLFSLDRIGGKLTPNFLAFFRRLSLPESAKFSGFFFDRRSPMVTRPDEILSCSRRPLRVREQQVAVSGVKTTGIGCLFLKTRTPQTLNPGLSTNRPPRRKG
jgi:hypothetical protein